ncbi:MAG TPA: ATP-binding protein, partial [Bacteroidia bacterium]|nr:ATP-binding protein [Bacteroidia bacterium]
LNMAEKAGIKSAVQESYQGLSKVFALKKDFHKAYDYYLKFTDIKDTLLNAERSKQLAQLQTQYESQKKDQQIVLLNAKNMLQQSENKKQTLLRNSFIAGFILIALVALLLLNRYRIKQRSEKALEQAYHHLQQTQQQLVHSEKMASLGQLTAGVAHEINNPINFVSANVKPLKRNFAELVDLIKKKKEISSDELNYTIHETHQLIGGIEEGSRRTAEIVKGLRNFSHIDEEEMKKTNINEGIESTLMLLRNKLTHSNIELITSFGNLPEIEGYPGQLNQVFINMITNAIDAIEENGKISIATSAENDGIKISIRDTGSGMTEETKKKIFDPFFTTKDVGKGTGLGLSISYGIIEKHNGKIEVMSEAGKGTEFVITLPV